MHVPQCFGVVPREELLHSHEQIQPAGPTILPPSAVRLSKIFGVDPKYLRPPVVTKSIPFRARGLNSARALIDTIISRV